MKSLEKLIVKSLEKRIDADVEKRIGRYPSLVMLNNAIRFLLRDEHPNITAIEEIVHAIYKAGGEIYADNVENLKKADERFVLYFGE